MQPLIRPCILVEKATGTRHACNFVINPPMPEDGGENYSCICEITGTPTINHKIWGFDSIQAIELSIIYLQVEFELLSHNFEILYLDGSRMDFFISPK